MLLAPGHAPLTFHPFANLFPMMAEADRAELGADIKAHGQIDPIMLHRGMILDGRNRYSECQRLGLGVTAEPFLGNDREALDYVISVNLRRRHLDESQRAIIAAKLAQLRIGDNQHTAAAQICASGPSLFDGKAAAAPAVPRAEPAPRATVPAAPAGAPAPAAAPPASTAPQREGNDELTRWVERDGRHIVSMTIDHAAGEHVGTCGCGAQFRQPRPQAEGQSPEVQAERLRAYAALDAMIEAHWRAVRAAALAGPTTHQPAAAAPPVHSAPPAAEAPPAAPAAALPAPAPGSPPADEPVPAPEAPVSQAAAADMLNVSRRSVQHAAVVLEQGAAELQEAVTQGAVAVSAAAEIARLPLEEQKRIIEQADPKAIRQVAKKKRAEKREAGRERKLEKMRKASAAPLVTGKKYGVIYVDIPRRFDPWSRETGLEKSPEMHYSTEPFDYLVGLPIRDLAADNCALLTYGWQPSLLDQIELMVEWGFASLRPRDDFGRLRREKGKPLPPVGDGRYRSHMVWGKRATTGNWHRGTGYWWINCHELLMLGVRGDVPCPLEGQQDMSILETVVGEHSAKPDAIRAMIDRYFPGVPKIELFARGDIDRARWPDWDFWGDEVTAAEPPATPVSAEEAPFLRACEIDVDPETVALTITAQSHPRLHEALTIVSHDSGSGASRGAYGIPPEWVDRVASIEAALAPLSKDELETFCIGEEGEAREIAERSDDLRAASGLLAAFFDGWRAGDDLDDDSQITDEFIRDLGREIAADRDGVRRAGPALAAGEPGPLADTPCTVVRAATHPRLYRALETVAADGGDHPGHDGYRIPKDWDLPTLYRIELALAQLDPDELEVLASARTAIAGDSEPIDGEPPGGDLDDALVLLTQFAAMGWAASAVPAGVAA
jgi:N6-adenosine-specific RNA methylase IME4